MVQRILGCLGLSDFIPRHFHSHVDFHTKLVAFLAPVLMPQLLGFKSIVSIFKVYFQGVDVIVKFCNRTPSS